MVDSPLCTRKGWITSDIFFLKKNTFFGPVKAFQAGIITKQRHISGYSSCLIQEKITTYLLHISGSLWPF